MARLRAGPNRTKPWKAEIKHRYKARFLGYFATWEEADEAERKKRKELTGKEIYKPKLYLMPLSHIRARDPETGRFIKGDLDVAS